MEITLESGETYIVDRRIYAESGISEGNRLEVSDVQRLLDADDRNAASNTAARILTVRARSTAELAAALRLRGYPEHIIADLVADFTDRGYLNDEEFARRWIALRSEIAPRAGRLLKRELRAKGIDQDIADQSLSEADLSDEQIAMDLANRRLGKMEGLPLETKRRRIAGFLERRGFNWEVVRAVDRELIQNMPADEPEPDEDD
jgi:regulatory protein